MTSADVSIRAPTTNLPCRMGSEIVSTGQTGTTLTERTSTTTTQSKWRKTIKRGCRANDLDALRLAFSIKINDKWNRELGRDHA